LVGCHSPASSRFFSAKLFFICNIMAYIAGKPKAPQTNCGLWLYVVSVSTASAQPP
jgi:hypothetical protein